MKISVLFLSLMTLSVFANANLCDSNWFATASGSMVRDLLAKGEDANLICSALYQTRPLHIALLTSEMTDPTVIEALISAGANILAENAFGKNPFEQAEERFKDAEARFEKGSEQYRREYAIYMNVNRAFDAGSPSADAHEQLCDVDWWRTSASGPAVEALLRIPGVDPNYTCNLSNDRPIHLPLKIANFIMLTRNIHYGIRALVDGDADLTVRNNNGDSAVRLAGIRYDRVRDRIIQQQIRWCKYEINNQQFANEITRNGPDVGAYLYITASATGESYDRLRDRKHMELYRVYPGKIVNEQRLCTYRGVNVK